MTTVTDNATHNDTTTNDTEITEITDSMRADAWYAFQQDQGFAERLEMAENAVDAATQEVTYRALMASPAMIRAYCADEWAVSHEEWQKLWAEFNTTVIDDAVASYINTMPTPAAPAAPDNEGGHWVVETYTHREWKERYEGTLDMCRAFLAGAVLVGFDEDIIRIARPSRSVYSVGELIDALASLPRDTPLRLTSGADAVLHEALTDDGMVTVEVGE